MAVNILEPDASSLSRPGLVRVLADHKHRLRPIVSLYDAIQGHGETGGRTGSEPSGAG